MQVAEKVQASDDKQWLRLHDVVWLRLLIINILSAFLVHGELSLVHWYVFTWI